MSSRDIVGNGESNNSQLVHAGWIPTYRWSQGIMPPVSVLLGLLSARKIKNVYWRSFQEVKMSDSDTGDA